MLCFGYILQSCSLAVRNVTVVMMEMATNVSQAIATSSSFPFPLVP